MSIEMDSENGQYHAVLDFVPEKNCLQLKAMQAGNETTTVVPLVGQIDAVTVGYVANGLRSGVPYELAKRLAEAVPDEYPDAPIAH
jgi:hypothetical protein